jgi:hypothetical protein
MQWSVFTRSNRPAKWTTPLTCEHSRDVKAIDHLNGNLGVHMSYTKAWTQEAGGDQSDAATCERTKNEIREEFVAKYFLLKSDPRRYGSLVATIQKMTTSWGKTSIPRHSAGHMI